MAPLLQTGQGVNSRKRRRVRKQQQKGGSKRARGIARLRKNINLLRVLEDTRHHSPQLRKAIVKTAPGDLVGSVSDCCRNVLSGRVPLSGKQKRQLSAHKQALRLLAQPRVGVQTKKRVLIQRGGFIGPLLAASLPIIANLLIRKFSGNKKQE